MLQVSRALPSWAAYVKYVNDIVVNGIVQVIYNSMRFVLDQMDVENHSHDGGQVMFNVYLSIVGKQLVCTPDIEITVGSSGGRDSIADIINDWIELFFETATMVRRLDNPTDDYLLEVGENDQLLRMQDMLITRVKSTLEKCTKLRDNLLQYSRFFAVRKTWHR